MANKYKKNNPLQNLSLQTNKRFQGRTHRPFWLPASGFYILSTAISIAVFFLIWGVLHEGDEETPWIFAGIVASFVLGGAVFLREVFLKNVRRRYLLAEKQLDYNLKNASLHSNVNRNRDRLSLKRNAAIIQEIRKKSEAAKILEHLPDGHWEVFEMCNEYLSVNEKQMKTVNIGSPRLPALRRSREIVEDLHKFHLLNWVEIESRLYTQESNNQVKIGDKIELIQRALTVIDSALQFYPEEDDLLDSRAALMEFAASIKISYWIEQAEREMFKENYQGAISLYRDALFYLARENVQSVEKEKVAEKINSEIELIRQLDNKNREKQQISHQSK